MIIKKKDDAPRKSFSLCIPGIPFVAAAVIIYGIPGSEKKKYLLRNLYDLESCNQPLLRTMYGSCTTSLFNKTSLLLIKIKIKKVPAQLNTFNMFN